jgi:hypothetical protein
MADFRPEIVAALKIKLKETQKAEKDLVDETKRYGISQNT